MAYLGVIIVCYINVDV